MTKYIVSISFLMAVLSLGFVRYQTDRDLRELVQRKQLKPLSKDTAPDSLKVELGRLLFFDKIISGNKDISCASCHHPTTRSGDNLALAIGVGGEGLGKSRQMGKNRHRIPRNSPEIFNRGADEWHTMFWDGRVARTGKAVFDTPAGIKLPQGLENVLAAQAMFPVISRDEMRGRIGDRDINGEVNELALISDAAPQSVWAAIMKRILVYEEYQRLFTSVYPEIPLEKLGFEHAANAIAAFEAEAYTFTGSPWDRYLAGEEEAVSESAKKGALIFYGSAACANCHSGNLMTDQAFHNLGIPQFGPGKGNGRPYDFGRYAETGQWEDRFAFRTPPLRNVSITGPWMHNGAYNNLEDAIRHHLNPAMQLRLYDPCQLEEKLQDTYHGDEQVINMISETLDPQLLTPRSLSEDDMEALMYFLESLTDSSALHMDHLIPKHLPSGLPLDGVNNERSSY